MRINSTLWFVHYIDAALYKSLFPGADYILYMYSCASSEALFYVGRGRYSIHRSFAIPRKNESSTKLTDSVIYTLRLNTYNTFVYIKDYHYSDSFCFSIITQETWPVVLYWQHKPGLLIYNIYWDKRYHCSDIHKGVNIKGFKME